MRVLSAAIVIACDIESDSFEVARKFGANHVVLSDEMKAPLAVKEVAGGRCSRFSRCTVELRRRDGDVGDGKNAPARGTRRRTGGDTTARRRLEAIGYQRKLCMRLL